jgi:inorganic pyrophosphatase
VSIDKYLEAAPIHDLSRTVARSSWARGHVAFTGSPRKHPYDRQKLVLIADPFSTHTTLFEFRVADVAHVEELPSLFPEEGEGVTMVRLWIRKGAVGLRYEPFVVEDTLHSANARLGSGDTGPGPAT